MTAPRSSPSFRLALVIFLKIRYSSLRFSSCQIIRTSIRDAKQDGNNGQNRESDPKRIYRGEMLCMQIVLSMDHTELDCPASFVESSVA